MDDTAVDMLITWRRGFKPAPATTKALARGLYLDLVLTAPGSSLRVRLIDRLISYTFRSTWRIEASASDAYDVLNDIGEYPKMVARGKGPHERALPSPIRCFG